MSRTGAGRARPSSWPPLRIAWWVVFVLLLITVVGIRIRLLGVPLERDEGEYTYAGQLLLQGIPPYQLAYNMKFPGVYAAYAFVIALFGQTPAEPASVSDRQPGSIALIFLIGRKLLRRDELAWRRPAPTRCFRLAPLSWSRCPRHTLRHAASARGDLDFAVFAGTTLPVGPLRLWFPLRSRSPHETAGRCLRPFRCAGYLVWTDFRARVRRTTIATRNVVFACGVGLADCRHILSSLASRRLRQVLVLDHRLCAGLREQFLLTGASIFCPELS